MAISNLVPSASAQLSFFQDSTVALNSVADRIRERHGARAMVSGRVLKYIQGTL